MHNGCQISNSHQRNTSLVSWFLVIKSKEGNKLPFHIGLNSILCNSGMNFTAVIGQGQSYEESSFEGTMINVCVFHRLKRCFCELIKYNRKVPLWKISGTFGTIPMKARK